MVVLSGTMNSVNSGPQGLQDLVVLRRAPLAPIVISAFDHLKAGHPLADTNGRGDHVTMANARGRSSVCDSSQSGAVPTLLSTGKGKAPREYDLSSSSSNSRSIRSPGIP